jgi:hypothetical protein
MIVHPGPKGQVRVICGTFEISKRNSGLLSLLLLLERGTGRP